MNESVDWDWLAREHAARFPGTHRKSRSLQSAYAWHQKRLADDAAAREQPPAQHEPEPAEPPAEPPADRVDGARKRYTAEQEDWLLAFVEETFDGAGLPRVWRRVADSYEAGFGQRRTPNMLQQKHDDLSRKQAAGQNGAAKRAASGSDDGGDSSEEEAAPKKRRLASECEEGDG